MERVAQSGLGPRGVRISTQFSLMVDVAIPASLDWSSTHPR